MENDLNSISHLSFSTNIFVSLKRPLAAKGQFQFYRKKSI